MYTFVPPLANVLTMTGTTLTGISSSVSDVINSTSVTMTVSLASYPSITKAITFNVIVQCTISPITMSANISNVSIGIDAQPFLIPFTFT